MSDIAIRIRGLGKRYTIGAREQHDTLRDRIAAAASRPFRRLAPGGLGASATIWALRDVTHESPRRSGRRHRRQRRRQVDAAEDPVAHHDADRRGKRKFTAASDRSSKSAPASTRSHRPGEHLSQRRDPRHARRARSTRKFDEIVDFAEVERVHRYAGEALLERHVRAARRSPWPRTWSRKS